MASPRLGFLTLLFRTPTWLPWNQHLRVRGRKTVIVVAERYTILIWCVSFFQQRQTVNSHWIGRSTRKLFSKADADLSILIIATKKIWAYIATGLFLAAIAYRWCTNLLGQNKNMRFTIFLWQSHCRENASSDEIGSTKIWTTSMCWIKAELRSPVQHYIKITTGLSRRRDTFVLMI